MKRIIEFLKGVIYELKKVSWPSRKELVGATVAVLLLTIFMAVFVGIIDFLFRKLITFILP